MTQALRLVKRFRDWANLRGMFARNTLDLEWRVTRRIRLADSDSLGYVRAHEQKGAL